MRTEFWGEVCGGYLSVICSYLTCASKHLLASSNTDKQRIRVKRVPLGRFCLHLYLQYVPALVFAQMKKHTPFRISQSILLATLQTMMMTLSLYMKALVTWLAPRPQKENEPANF